MTANKFAILEQFLIFPISCLTCSKHSFRFSAKITESDSECVRTCAHLSACVCVCVRARGAMCLPQRMVYLLRILFFVSQSLNLIVLHDLTSFKMFLKSSQLKYLNSNKSFHESNSLCPIGP
jgi:hypothetical protein